MCGAVLSAEQYHYQSFGYTDCEDIWTSSGFYQKPDIAQTNEEKFRILLVEINKLIVDLKDQLAVLPDHLNENLKIIDNMKKQFIHLQNDFEKTLVLRIQEVVQAERARAKVAAEKWQQNAREEQDQVLSAVVKASVDSWRNARAETHAEMVILCRAVNSCSERSDDVERKLAVAKSEKMKAESDLVELLDILAGVEHDWSTLIMSDLYNSKKQLFSITNHPVEIQSKLEVAEQKANREEQKLIAFKVGVGESSTTDRSVIDEENAFVRNRIANEEILHDDVSYDKDKVEPDPSKLQVNKHKSTESKQDSIVTNVGVGESPKINGRVIDDDNALVQDRITNKEISGSRVSDNKEKVEPDPSKLEVDEQKSTEFEQKFIITNVTVNKSPKINEIVVDEDNTSVCDRITNEKIVDGHPLDGKEMNKVEPSPCCVQDVKKRVAQLVIEYGRKMKKERKPHLRRQLDMSMDQKPHEQKDEENNKNDIEYDKYQKKTQQSPLQRKRCKNHRDDESACDNEFAKEEC